MNLFKNRFKCKNYEIEGKIPIITALVTNSALTAVENKKPDVRNLVKKTDYNTKTSEIENRASDHDHDKYVTTSEFHKLTAESFKTRLAQANLVTKTDFDAKLTSLNENRKGKNNFEEDGTQNVLVF